MDNSYAADLASPESPALAACCAHLDATVEEVYTCMLRAVCLLADDEPSGPCIRAFIRIDGEYAAECAVEVPAVAGESPHRRHARIRGGLGRRDARRRGRRAVQHHHRRSQATPGPLARRLPHLASEWRPPAQRSPRRSTLRRITLRRVYCFGDDRIAVTLSFLAWILV